MSSEESYISEYTKHIIDAGRDYVNSRSINKLFGRFFIDPETEQGKYVLSVLKSRDMLYDTEYDAPPFVDEDFSLTCTVCNTANYNHWKLIGYTNDLGCQVVKCIVPYFLCEKCYRKRFCHQDNNLLTCGVAVFSPADFLVSNNRNSFQKGKRSSLQLKPVSSNHRTVSPRLSPNVSHTSSAISVPPPPVLHPSASVQSSVTSTSSDRTVIELNASGKSSEPEMSLPSESKIQSEVISINQSVGSQELEELRNMEVTFTVQSYKQHGFRKWVKAFVVIDSRSIRKYPNEKRLEKKQKEILLYDATFSHSTVDSGNRRPYCVYISPGPSSARTKQFVFSLASSKEESDFLEALKKFSAVARQFPPPSEETQQDDSLFCV